MRDSSNNINQLSSYEYKKRIIRDKSNKDLSIIRKTIALQLEDKLIMTLKKLGIPNVRFKVVFEECEPTINGIDKVNFMFSANPGLPLAPLSEKILVKQHQYLLNRSAGRQRRGRCSER